MTSLLIELLPGLLLGAASLTLAVRLRRRRAFVTDPQRLRILAGLAAAGGGLWILAAASRVPAISMAAAGPVLVLAAAGFTIATAVTLWRLLPELERRPRMAQLQARSAEVEQENRELGARIDSLGTLAGGLAHDFNNLLTVIAGHTDLLRRSEQPEQREESLQALDAATERAEALCRRMLAYSGRGHFLLSPTRLVDCIRIDAEATAEAGIHLELQLEDDLPLIDAAPDQVRQMATELIANAVEAAREADLGPGEVHVSATRAELDADTLAHAVYPHALEPGEAVVLEVVDTGPGFSAIDVYLTSGFSRGEIHDPELQAELAGFLPKPFRLEDFADLFRPGETPETP